MQLSERFHTAFTNMIRCRSQSLAAFLELQSMSNAIFLSDHTYVASKESITAFETSVSFFGDASTASTVMTVGPTQNGGNQNG